MAKMFYFSYNNFFNNTIHWPLAVYFCKCQLMFFCWDVHFSEDTKSYQTEFGWTSLCFHLHHVHVLYYRILAYMNMQIMK